MKVSFFSSSYNSVFTMYVGNRKICTMSRDSYIAIHANRMFTHKDDLLLSVNINGNTEVRRVNIDTDIILCMWYDRVNFLQEKGHMKK